MRTVTTRTPDQILAGMLGNQALIHAHLQAEVERLRVENTGLVEELATLKLPLPPRDPD